MQAEEMWHNSYQLIIGQANPRAAVVRVARRGGKTEIIMPKRTLGPLSKMPGCSGYMAGRSHSKMFDHLLPGVIAGWAKLKFIEGEDYVIGIKPPKKWPKPIMPPKKFDHYISTRFGSGMHLISFDHTSTSNGVTTDFGVIDEAKQLNPERVKSELLKTMSGHRNIRLNNHTVWGDLPEHLMITFLSDAYIGKYDYNWLEDFKSEAMPWIELCELAALSERVQTTKDPLLQRVLWEKQSNAFAFLEYSSRESLPVIGIDYYKMQFKNSTSFEFRTSILNEIVTQVEGGFYTYLDELVHTYEARDNARLDAIGYSDYLKGLQKNCRLDKDVRDDIPLKLGVDYGSDNSWFVVGQKYADTYWCLNNFITVEGEHFLTGVDKFASYYHPHKTKIVELSDDPSGHKKNMDQERDVERVVKRLKEHGWQVKRVNEHNRYISHHAKYRIHELIMNEQIERKPSVPKFRININNAYETYISMSRARLKTNRNKDEYAKDKGEEGTLGLEEWKATHLSDAWDNIVCFENTHLLDEKVKLLTW